MRTLASLAAAVLAAGLIASSPAAAFDDSLPGYAPYRPAHVIHHHVYVPRYRHVYRIYPRRLEYVRFVHRQPWACRTHYRHACAYRLGGFFARNPDFRRLPWYR